jgi:hypothetical protein
MLFDLAADPLEQNNIAAQHPEIVRDAAFRLMNWHDAQMQKTASGKPTHRRKLLAQHPHVAQP